ncbi:unnamed protein product [Pedinophyceae sp. YPF-701]|nr:unnamed protein product [Pedinophyceae sp. YPF-701]
MVVFGNPATLEWVADLCHVLKIDRDLAQQRKAIKDKHACIFVPYPADEKVTKRFDYPYGNSFHFMLDPRAKSLFPDFYGWVLRSDWDVFYTPSLGSLCPETFRTGVGAYTDFSPSHPGDPNTADHLKELSKLYGLRHRGEHNVGSTWFGRTPEILALARLTYNVMPLLLKFHFEQKDPAHGEGPAHVLDGVGWQRWYAGVTLLYAGELASNHLLDEFEKSDQMDAASHGSVPVSDVFSIHCWWVEEPFAKFQFFAHHYDFMSLDGLDTSIAKDYCMDIALRSYRGIEE